MSQQAVLAARAAGRSPDQTQITGVREPYVDGPTVASIQTIFQRSRLSRQSWSPRQLQGRLDSRHAWRNDARGSVDIFKERYSPSVTKLNVWLLVDASGSMAGSRACRAQDVVATLIEAYKWQPTIRLHVWQHNANENVSMYRVYEPGTGNKVEQMLKNIAGGNADGFALQWVGDKARKARRPDERDLVIVISDGQPSVHGKDATKNDLSVFSSTVSARLRSKGVEVMSVAIAGDRGANAAMYGPESVVRFRESEPTAWSDLARDFASIFGRILRDAHR